jgi:uncharacterized protein (DUF1697 family)
MTAFVSLFRSINVGGQRKIKMSELKEVHEALGLWDVTPYIQSGSVVFQSDDVDGERMRGQIEESFEKRFGFHSDVMIRNAAELQAIIEANPFQGLAGKETRWIVVLFLAAHPDAAAQENLRTSYSGPEEFFLIGQELHIYYPDGIGRSKFSGGFIEKKLKMPGTARNWNTIMKLQELMQH